MGSSHDNILDLSKGQLMPREEVLDISHKKSKLTIGIPCELSGEEKRVPIVPQAAGLLVANGHDVMVETKAGEAARFSDEKYSSAGARIVYTANEIYQADVVIKVAPPTQKELNQMKGRQTLISALQFTSRDSEYFKELINKRISAIAFEYIRDNTGTHPVRRSMSEIVGNTVILIAAEYMSNTDYGKGCMLGGFTGISPSTVVILGAGTVGEYAARAAIGLGATVKVFDNSIYKLRRLQQALHERVFTSILQPNVLQKALAHAEVVICAVHSDVGRSPVLVTEDMVQQMKKGAVIIDASIDQGGCVETSSITSHKDPVFIKHDVTHYCVPNIASKVPHTASYSLSNFFAPLLLRVGEEGGINNVLRKDQGIRSGVYTFNGTITKEIISNRFMLPFQDIDLLMAALQR